MESEGRRLHAQAAQAREAGQFSESLDFNDRALFAYDLDNDSLGFAEGIACRSITLRVYANQHDSKRILALAKHEMMASVEIARVSGNAQALAMPLYNLAQVHEDLGELTDAVATYREAVDNMVNNPPDNHNRPSVLANMKLHLATCELGAGDKSAFERATQALHELETSEEPNKYNKDVWGSGGYMRLAKALREIDVPKAKEFLQKAKEIIDNNSKLVLRKQQWDKLASSLEV